jgi:hypothetical protein
MRGKRYAQETTATCNYNVLSRRIACHDIRLAAGFGVLGLLAVDFFASTQTAK